MNENLDIILSLRTGEDDDAAVVGPLVDGVDIGHVGPKFAEHQLEVRRVAGLQLRSVRKPPHILGRWGLNELNNFFLTCGEDILSCQWIIFSFMENFVICDFVAF